MTLGADGGFHLFLVHSHITDIVARGVINRRLIPLTQVAFLTTRGFSPPPDDKRDFPLVPFDFDLVPRGRKQRPTMWQGWRTLATIDRRLKQLTGGRRFHLYTPQTMEHIAQVLKNSSACSGFSFIEEGLYSYCTREQIERSHPPRRPRRWERLAYRNRIRASRFFDTGNTAAYGLHREVFPDLQGRVVLDGVLPRVDRKLASGVAHVLVFDSLAVYRRIRLESLLAALQRLLVQLREQGIGILHYKLHPAQVGTDEQQAVEKLLRSAAGLKVQRLADVLSLEGLARAQPGIRWYVSLSSVGLYAALFGGVVYSYAPWIAAVEPEFQGYIDQAPPVFATHVRDL